MLEKPGLATVAFESQQEQDVFIARMGLDHEVTTGTSGGAAKLLLNVDTGFSSGGVRGLEELMIVEREVAGADAGASSLRLSVALSEHAQGLW